MIVEVGKNYYVFSHAYHHFLVKVVTIHGPERIEVTHVRRIQSSQLNWTDFFKRGATRENTVMTDFPDGMLSGWFGIFAYPHKIPGAT